VNLVAAVLRQASAGAETRVSADDAIEFAFIAERLEMLQGRLDFWRRRAVEVGQEPAKVPSL
jgi:hypothetical protein